MGQQQSSEDKKGSGSRSGTPVDKHKVRRRRSLHPAPNVGERGRSTPAQASTSTASATAQATTSQHLDPSQLQQTLDTTSPEPSSKNKIGRSSSKREKRDEPPTPQRQEPVNVPTSSNPMNVPTPSSSKSKPDDFEDRYLEKSNFDEHQSEFERRYVPPADHRPPRLPLPIADAGPIPDSPTLAPIDKGRAGSDLELFGNEHPLAGTEPQLRKRSSMLSTATQDDESIGDELPPVDPEATTIPTTIEWNYSGHRIYVTGTFANWEKKYRMHHK